jgi:hypothetical protein
VNLEIRLNNSEVIKELGERGSLLEAALLEAVGSLGSQLLALVRSKILPVVRTPIGQEFLDSIMLQAAAFVDQVCSTSVGIDNEGQPSYIVAYVREFGGENWYDIYPHEAVFGAVGLSGAGRLSQHSAENSIALEEGRLPHALAWAEGGGMVFAKHVYHPPAVERSYLRSSLAEMQDEVQAQLTRTIAEVLAA